MVASWPPAKWSLLAMPVCSTLSPRSRRPRAWVDSMLAAGRPFSVRRWSTLASSLRMIPPRRISSFTPATTCCATCALPFAPALSPRSAPPLPTSPSRGLWARRRFRMALCRTPARSTAGGRWSPTRARWRSTRASCLAGCASARGSSSSGVRTSSSVSSPALAASSKLLILRLQKERPQTMAVDAAFSMDRSKLQNGHRICTVY
mmetsp:Transcript_38877/g.82825  ORF Transcript_38877/g.82825 Transcript_38877/m.82825 type:complete len:205 (+) Transcript_38877:504-1118(+)